VDWETLLYRCVQDNYYQAASHQLAELQITHPTIDVFALPVFPIINLKFR